MSDSIVTTVPGPARVITVGTPGPPGPRGTDGSGTVPSAWNQNTLINGNLSRAACRFGTNPMKVRPNAGLITEFDGVQRYSGQLLNTESTASGTLQERWLAPWSGTATGTFRAKASVGRVSARRTYGPSSIRSAGTGPPRIASSRRASRTSFGRSRWSHGRHGAVRVSFIRYPLDPATCGAIRRSTSSRPRGGRGSPRFRDG
jgi:hypothetical protein